jgi:hypothetical protein
MKENYVLEAMDKNTEYDCSGKKILQILHYKIFFVFSRISYGQSISTGWCSSVYAKFRLMEILLRRSSEWKALSTNIIIEAKKNQLL